MTRKVRALIDSGCDATSFPTDWAAELGIDFDACTPINGITAAGKDEDQDESLWPRVWEPGVDALFLGQKIHLNAVFRPGLVPVLLGREDFFNHFMVRIDNPRKRFWLKSHNA